MKVKICGMKTLEEALVALDAGADLLGFNFYSPSPRFINPPDCARLVADLRRYDCRAVLVGVFVNLPTPEIVAILDDCGLDLAQLSGDEPPEDLIALGERAFKALRPAGFAALKEDLRRYPQRLTPPVWLVDASCPGQYGGTGKGSDWSLAGRLARQVPILLAGGLNPENVTGAICQVQPWGVDVASGVESTPGRKDPEKMRAFIKAAHACEENKL